MPLVAISAVCLNKSRFSSHIRSCDDSVICWASLSSRNGRHWVHTYSSPRWQLLFNYRMSTLLYINGHFLRLPFRPYSNCGCKPVWAKDMQTVYCGYHALAFCWINPTKSAALVNQFIKYPLFDHMDLYPLPPGSFSSYCLSSSVIYLSAFTRVCFLIHSSGTLSLCALVTSR